MAQTKKKWLAVAVLVCYVCATAIVRRLKGANARYGARYGYSSPVEALPRAQAQSGPGKHGAP